jgi:hypothetical protein
VLCSTTILERVHLAVAVALDSATMMTSGDGV